MLIRSIKSAAPALALIGAGFMIAACAEQASSPTGLRPGAIQRTLGDEGGAFKICKDADTPGTYTFALTKTGGGDGQTQAGETTFPTTFSITLDPSNLNVCKDVWFPTNLASWTTPATITVTEQVPSGMYVDAVWVFQGGQLPQQFTGTNTVTLTLNYNASASAEYYNRSSGGGGFEGCTPGYWKVDKHAFAWIPTGYSRSQSVNSVFSNANVVGLGGYTLLEALSFKGGSTLQGGGEILLRAAVSALLNASSPAVSYKFSAASIISDVNAALASGDRSAMIELAAKLDEANNALCPLGNGK